MTRRNLAPGVLLAFEGIDGAGKTTQVHLLAETLRREGFEVVTTKEPTKGPWGQRLRDSAKEGRLSLEDELHAFIEDRKQHAAELLRPSIAAGKVVLVDRYYISTAAYQGARGVEVEFLLRQNEAIAPIPDLVFLLDVPVDTGIERIRARGDTPNKFEGREQLTAVAAAYARVKREYVLRLDASRGIPPVQDDILRALRDGPLFDRLCHKRDRLTACEPEFCSYRMNGSCEYPGLPPRRSAIGADELRAAISEHASPEDKLGAVTKLLSE